ncbi:MAG: ABC transporter permease [Anaerolineales bacterium]|nr:ABC transporter permease [Anaerolineales bacterium]
MKSFWKLTLAECKIYFRFPIAAFFTLGLLPMILLILGAVFTNDPNPQFGGRGFLDWAVPGFIAIVIAMSALLALPMALTTYRERGILRRYRATPVSPAAVLGAQLVLQFAMTILGMLLLILIGKLFFHLRFEGNIASVVAAFTLGCLSFFSIGMILGGVMPNTRTGTIIGNVLLQPMLYLSGVIFPKEVMSEGMQKAIRFNPLTHVAALLQGLWRGDAWSEYQMEVLVLGAVMVVAGVIAVLVFRWE